jgi:hypothetical protein
LHTYDYSIPAQAEHQALALRFQVHDHARLILHPQIAAALVAHDTLSHDGHRLLDEHTLDAVLVLMLATSILGPVLTERFAPA